MNGDTITAAVLMHVKRAAGRRRKPVVTREFSLGSSSVRADLAILGDEFVGIEVKGHRDTLRRLSTQMEAYRRYFDRTIVVAANRHLKALDKNALWGAALWSFDIVGNLVELKPGAGPFRVTTEQYLEMLTQEERRRALRGYKDSSSSSDVQIDQASARAIFFDIFKRRYGSISDKFWKETSRRPITPADLPQISRFLTRRQEARRLEAEKDDFWNWWGEQHARSGDS